MIFDSISQSDQVSSDDSTLVSNQINKTKSQPTKFFAELNRHQKIQNRKIGSQNQQSKKNSENKIDKRKSPTFKQMIMASNRELEKENISTQQIQKALSREKLRFPNDNVKYQNKSKRRPSIQKITQFNFYETIKRIALELSEQKKLCNDQTNISLSNLKSNESLFSGYTEKQFHDGTNFKGICQNGVIIKGLLHFSNGFKYEGELFLDKFHGKGKLTLPKKQVIEADWIQGQIVGKATIKYPKGQIYYGDLKNFRRHGKGHLFFNDGSKYEGEFNEGELTGYGVHITALDDKTCGYWFYGDYIGTNEQVFDNIMSNATAHENKKSDKVTQNIKSSSRTSRTSQQKSKDFFEELFHNQHQLND